jgi:hypothetical protein
MSILAYYVGLAGFRKEAVGVPSRSGRTEENHTDFSED